MAKITILNNKNTSPKRNLENEKKNKGLIVASVELEAVAHILEILENEGLIKKPLFDRTDKDTEEEHTHYYFDSGVNNNTLQSIIKSYVNDKKIDYKKIEEQKEIILEKGTIKTAGILDIETTDISESFTEATSGNDNISYIAKDKYGITVYKSINSNLGIAKDKVLTDLSSYNFTFHFDKDLADLEISESDIKISLNEALTQSKDFDTSYINLKTSSTGNQLNINFDNLLKSKEDNQFFMFSKKNIKDVLENFLKNLAEKTELKILSDRMRYYKNEADILKKPIIKKMAQAKHESGSEHLSEAEQEEFNNVDIETIQEEAEKSQATTDFYLDFMVEIKTIKTFEELEAKKAELEAEQEKVEAVKGILPVELINEKLEQIADKKELLSIVKVERTAEQELREELEATKQSLAAQTQMSEELNDKLVKTVSELETANENYKRLDTNHERILKEHSEDLDNWETERDEFKMEIGRYQDLNKSLEEQAVKNRTEIKETAQNLEAEKATTKKLNEELAERTHELGEATAKLETANNLIEEQEESINDLTIMSEQQSKAYSILETKQTETLEELKAEKLEVKKYNKLYSDTVSKLEKTELKLNTVNQKLADKEKENKSLLREVKDFVEEVLNLKGSNSNLIAQKVVLEKEKVKLNTNIQDIGEELRSALNEVKTTNEDLENGKEEAKNYLADLEAQHETEKEESSAYVKELLARIEELEGREGPGEKEKKKIVKAPTPKPKK